jgi:hypothetical protein
MIPASESLSWIMWFAAIGGGIGRQPPRQKRICLVNAKRHDLD